jgi:hypothetical protein
MNRVRAFYDRLPEKIRRTIRSLLPGDLLRWYAHRNTDVYLISYPKCGRTWLRLMIGRAIASHYNLPDEEHILFLRWKRKPHPRVPAITVIHEDRPMLKAPHELEPSKARYKNKKVIFLVRDPRDVIVSSYFEMNRRGRIFGKNPYETREPVFEGSLSEFIQRSAGGFDTILAYYNIWANNRHIPGGFLIVRYEDLKENPQRELRRTLDFLELGDISDETIVEAVEYASFDNMRRMEREGKFQTGILKPANHDDKESYKTRQGEVKGYVNYLRDDEIALLNQKIKNELIEIYGYNA